MNASTFANASLGFLTRIWFGTNFHKQLKEATRSRESTFCVVPGRKDPVCFFLVFFVCWSRGWLVGWLVGRSVSWLVGWLVGWLAASPASPASLGSGAGVVVFLTRAAFCFPGLVFRRAGNIPSIPASLGPGVAIGSDWVAVGSCWGLV